MLPAGLVERIDATEKKVYVDRTKDQIKDAPGTTKRAEVGRGLSVELPDILRFDRSKPAGYQNGRTLTRMTSSTPAGLRCARGTTRRQDRPAFRPA
jgi:hypothetical protein